MADAGRGVERLAQGPDLFPFEEHDETNVDFGSGQSIAQSRMAPFHFDP